MQWAQWFVLGGALGWPLATMLGRRGQRYQGGVPAIPQNRWIEEHHDVRVGKTTTRLFRKYAFATCFLTGFCLATYMTDTAPLRDADYTRPDFGPKAAMVKEHIPRYDPMV